MHASKVCSSGARRALAFLALLSMMGFTTAHAAMFTYTTSMSGPNESPPNGSPGTGTAQVDIDDVANTMRVQASFTGLQGTTSAAHIHAPTPTAGSGVAGVATTQPSFVGFPLGVTSGNMDQTYNLNDASTYNSTYITNNGGTVAGARGALLQALAEGKAYFNIHTSAFSGGEIRGFFLVVPVELSQFSID